jgi:uncharacterized protein YabN with tetrapyrrole methylase and pyrophosphatase domain
MNKISYEERTKVYTDALETFGPTAQLVVALEEMSEVQKEICKTLRGGGSTLHLAEEVADATIMLEQIRQIFDINEEVCKAMDHKVLRLRQRVEDAQARERPNLEAIRALFRKDDANG